MSWVYSFQSFIVNIVINTPIRNRNITGCQVTGAPDARYVTVVVRLNTAFIVRYAAISPKMTLVTNFELVIFPSLRVQL
jgi:hypothetical protein